VKFKQYQDRSPNAGNQHHPARISWDRVGHDWSKVLWTRKCKVKNNARTTIGWHIPEDKHSSNAAVTVKQVLQPALSLNHTYTKHIYNHHPLYFRHDSKKFFSFFSCPCSIHFNPRQVLVRLSSDARLFGRERD
jgi:hypothetical protein